MRHSKNASFAASAAAAAALLGGTVTAQAADDFYAKNDLKILIGTAVGGSYDRMGRLTARHIVNHLPGKPSAIVQNMPGGGSLIATNFLYNVAPQDGSVLGCVVPGIILTALFKEPSVKYDPNKMQWIGNAMDGSPVPTVFHTTPYKTLAEMKEHEVIMGAGGISGFDATNPKIFNALLGTKFKVVTGYKGGESITLAMERGEVHGRGAQAWAGWKAVRPDWIRDRKIIPIMQVTLEPIDDPYLKGVPLFVDLVQEKDKALARSFTALPNMGRPTAMGPGVPRGRVETMRTAYAAMVEDPAFLEDARKQRVNLKPISGEKLQDMVKTTYSLDEKQARRLYTILEFDKRKKKGKK